MCVVVLYVCCGVVVVCVLLCVCCCALCAVVMCVLWCSVYCEGRCDGLHFEPRHRGGRKEDDEARERLRNRCAGQVSCTDALCA